MFSITVTVLNFYKRKNEDTDEVTTPAFGEADTGSDTDTAVQNVIQRKEITGTVYNKTELSDYGFVHNHFYTSLLHFFLKTLLLPYYSTFSEISRDLFHQKIHCFSYFLCPYITRILCYTKCIRFQAKKYIFLLTFTLIHTTNNI